VLKLLEKETAGKFAPGSQWSYSNSGYVVLGLVVAKISGMPFREFLQERIFTPLKMAQTLAFEKGKNEVSQRAYGHSKEANAWRETDQSPTSATLGDGGIYSSLTDLAKWDEALAQYTLLREKEMQPALSPAQLTNGAQPQWPANSDRPAGTPVSYGFGWFLDPYHNHTRRWHYGDTIGFHAYITRFPADRLTVVILCNRTDLDPESLALKVADLYFSVNK
jgi:CubicO group peptidase (beta-lactamase class C family)